MIKHACPPGCNPESLSEQCSRRTLPYTEHHHLKPICHFLHPSQSSCVVSKPASCSPVFFYRPGSQPPLTSLLILLANESTGTLPGIDCLLLNSENLKGSKYKSFFPLHFSIFIFLLTYSCLTMFWVYHKLIQVYIYMCVCVCVCVFFFRLFHYKLLQDIEYSSPH